jgi:hypothetical protein
MASSKPKVYRVRSLPLIAKTKSLVGQLIAERLDLNVEDVEVCSLANEVRGDTRTATLMLRTAPGILPKHNDHPECRLRDESRRGGSDIILDCHFFGITPLNHVDEEAHQYK